MPVSTRHARKGSQRKSSISAPRSASTRRADVEVEEGEVVAGLGSAADRGHERHGAGAAQRRDAGDERGARIRLGDQHAHVRVLHLPGERGQVGGRGRDSRHGLDGRHDLEAEAPGEVRPALVDHDDLGAAIRAHRVRPALEPGVEALEEGRAARLEVRAIAWGEARERFQDARGDRPRVLGIEPVVRVAEAVDVVAPLGLDPRNDGLQKVDALRAVEDVRAARCEAGVAERPQQPRQPRLVVHADPDEERRAAERGDLRRLDLDRVRVRERRGERFDAHAVAADLLDQRLEVGRGGHDGQRAAAPRGSGGPEQRGAEKRPLHRATSW